MFLAGIILTLSDQYIWHSTDLAATLRSERKTEAEGWHDLFMKVRLMDHGSKVWNLRYRTNSKHAPHRLMFPALQAVAIKMKYNSISCMANIEQLLQPFNITCQRDIWVSTEMRWYQIIKKDTEIIIYNWNPCPVISLSSTVWCIYV